MVKTIFFFFLTFNFFSTSHAEMNWENPPVLCPEEILPRGFDCPDFSSVNDPYNDFPATLSQEDIVEWTTHRSVDLRICRNKEVLRREKEKPGTFSEATLKAAWLMVDGGRDASLKLKVIQKASADYGIPPQILIGALKQESLLSSVGVMPDGGNYSCGIAQLNIDEWCESMSTLSLEKKVELGWPDINCDSAFLPTESVRSFYEYAVKKNNGSKPMYQMTAQDYEGIMPPDVNLPEQVFKAVLSYINHCQDFALSIPIKASILKNLYDHFVPVSFKEREQYSEGKTFARTCNEPYPVKSFPLNTGWLLTTAMYNAGPVQSKLVGFYYQVKDNQFPTMNPLDLIESLHWGGKWKEGTDLVSFTDQKGKEYTQRWIKSCIVQRHVARVIQHVTELNQTIAKSLEQEGCKQSVPLYRRVSSGIKEVPSAK